MTDRETILEAHVRFELDRWRGEARQVMLEEEVAALFGWLESLRLTDLVDPEEVRRWARRVLCAPLTDDLLRGVEDVVGAAHRTLSAEQATLGEVLTRDAYDQAAETFIGMRALREEFTTQLTTNSAYSRLVSHVLYFGIKNYLLTQNVVARRVPGASSLMRFGQQALNSAAPNLERGIDRQLVAFINLNVHETIKESRRFLDATLDDDLLRTVAAEIWEANAGRSVGEAVDLVGEGSVTELVAAAWDAVSAVRSSPVVGQLVDQVVTDFFTTNGDRPVAELIEEAGLTRDWAAEELSLVAASVIDTALETGYLEARIRARLDAFYSGYFAESPPKRSPRTRRT
ncbi:MAG: hypothetical protein MUC45_01145 [Actinomycetia bacterium]|nr:hypothetical protein [Actinomycetes bacterium]